MSSRRRVLGTLGLGVAGFAGCAGRVTDGRVGDSNDEANRRRWSAKLGSDIETPGLTVADGSVYVSTTETLFALDRKTGEVRWRVGSEKNGDDRRPHFTKAAVHEGAVYVGTWDGRGLLALDAEDGSERWRYAPSGSDDPRIVVPPRPLDRDWNSLVVADGSGNVRGLSLDTRKPRWEFQVFGEPSALIAVGSIVYVGTNAGEFYAVNYGDGLWRRKLPGKILDVRADGINAYVSTFGGGVFVLEGGAFAGTTKWRAKQGPGAHTLVLTDKTIYGGDMARLMALDRQKGTVEWALDGDFNGGLAFANDTLYAGRDGKLVALARNGGVGVGSNRFGARRWAASVDGSVRRTAVVNEVLYFLASDSKGRWTAYAFDA